MGWDTRQSWTGELPAAEAVLLQRFDNIMGSGSTRTAPDAVGRDWTIRNFANSAHVDASRWGQRFTFNENAPATERTSMTVPHFAGMWPSSGKILLTAWAALRYAMGFTPIISTRNTPGAAPLVYLSTMADGRPRAQVYSATGALIHDQNEVLPWSTTIGEWLCFMLLVDLDAKTSQIAVVRHTAAEAHMAPVRAFTGEPNLACVADFEALTLSPAASYWANGRVDEIGLFHPGPGFDFAAHVEAVRRNCWAEGANHETGGAANLTVSEQQVTATGAATLRTGAEHRTWQASPAVDLAAPISGTAAALLSDDGGATWSDPIDAHALPASFDGLVRWLIPLEQGEVFRGLELVEPEPVPVLDPVADVAISQHDAIEVAISGSWRGVPQFEVVAETGIHATIEGTTLTITSGLSAGAFTVTLTATDDTEQTSEPVTIRVDVAVLPWEPPENPVFPRAPLIVHNDAGRREVVIDDPAEAKLGREVNGAQTLTFVLPATHPKALALAPERTVEAAGDRYRIRRLTHTRDGGVPMVEAYCEAGWYDLRTAGRVRERDFNGATAAQSLEYVLQGTGWTIGAVTVTTRRTWTMEAQTSLAALRAIADVHGGDLTFDNEARTVSLLTFAGRDRGVAFFHGQALTDAKRVEDTTQLLTRIEPRNEEGVGIESVNGGVPYLEDYSFTDEIKHGIYNFASGTSPQTMLAMTVAAIGKRAQPAVSYEATIADLSAWSGQSVDRFDVGDRVLIVDPELGIESTQRIVAMDYDLLHPWQSRITLSEKLRELGSDAAGGANAGVLSTGADIDTRDIVPFNLLRNARFDNGLAHWAASGATVVDGGATGNRSVRFGSGTRWIEQTVAVDTRDAYTFSMQVDHDGGPANWLPDMQVVAEVTYSDGTTETITLELT